jgi:hypothetical protein
MIKIIPAFLIVESQREKQKIGMNTKGLLKIMDE